MTSKRSTLILRGASILARRISAPRKFLGLCPLAEKIYQNQSGSSIPRDEESRHRQISFL
jgi:hypothetical protein